MPPQSTRGGPRQRILPTPRGVNMIAWSLDNRFVLAAIMGNVLMSFQVWLVHLVELIFALIALLANPFVSSVANPFQET